MYMYILVIIHKNAFMVAYTFYNYIQLKKKDKKIIVYIYDHLFTDNIHLQV